MDHIGIDVHKRDSQIYVLCDTRRSHGTSCDDDPRPLGGRPRSTGSPAEDSGRSVDRK